MCPQDAGHRVLYMFPYKMLVNSVGDVPAKTGDSWYLSIFTSAVDWMLCVPSKFMCWKLTLNIMVSLPRLGHEGGALMNGMNSLKKRSRRVSALSL